MMENMNEYYFSDAADESDEIETIRLGEHNLNINTYDLIEKYYEPEVMEEMRMSEELNEMKVDEEQIERIS